MVINRIIREIADESFLSVDDISHLTHINSGRVYEIIINHSSPTPSEAFSICDAFGVDLENVLNGY